MQSAKTRPGADCGSNHELLIAEFRLKLKKVGKTTKPFRYDLNQIPYNYTVEVTNGFKTEIQFTTNIAWENSSSTVVTGLPVDLEEHGLSWNPFPFSFVEA